MIFLWVGLAIVGVCAFVYACYKWIIPAIIKSIKSKKEKKELENQEKFNEVQLASKDTVITGVKPEEVEYGSNREEYSYVKNIDDNAVQDKNALLDVEDEDFDKFLKSLENEKNDNIKNEIKHASPKLKAILMSGVLQDKKYDE